MNNDITAKSLETGGDELERYALEECNKRRRVDSRVSVLVMPAGHCELAGRFAELGAQVTVADLAARRPEVEGRILAGGRPDEIRFTPCDLPAIPDEAMAGEPFDLIVLRRGLCSLPYGEARRVVRQLLLRLKIGGKLYVSIIGLHSELGEGYGGNEAPLEERYAELAPTMIDKYGIRGPVCLYSERNLFQLLLEAGGSVLRTLTTTYGNVKGIAVRV